MSEKRRNKKKSRKGIFKTIFVTILILLALGIVGFAFLFFSKKTLYISPLPINYKLSSHSDRDQNKITLEKLLKEKNIEYLEITTSNNNLVIKLKNKSKIFLSNNKDLPTQIASLQFILTRLTMESKGFKELDLRFNKPVIRQ